MACHAHELVQQSSSRYHNSVNPLCLLGSAVVFPSFEARAHPGGCFVKIESILALAVARQLSFVPNSRSLYTMRVVAPSILVTGS